MMLELISLSCQNFDDKCIHLKLFRHFWRSVRAYFKGRTYKRVLKMYFIYSCSGTAQTQKNNQ